MKWGKLRDRFEHCSGERGFTIIELLVAIIVIAILAVVAIPVFTQQRARGWEAQAMAASRNAGVAVQSYAVERQGDYSGLDGATGASADLTGEGYRPTADVSVAIKASSTAYCVTATHANLSEVYKYSSTTGKPEAGACTGPTG